MCVQSISFTTLQNVKLPVVGYRQRAKLDIGPAHPQCSHLHLYVHPSSVKDETVLYVDQDILTPDTEDKTP